MTTKYTAQADAALSSLYQLRGADTTQQKIVILQDHLGSSNFYALGGEINDEMKLGCLEYDYLEFQGLIETCLA
jgi:hypothetical protein